MQLFNYVTAYGTYNRIIEQDHYTQGQYKNVKILEKT